jgi:hypothetical protein
MPQQIIGFGIVGFVLITGSDFDATAPIAVAFAYVILLTVLLTVGPVAFDRIANLTKGN